MKNKTNADDLEKVSGGVNYNHSDKVSLSYSDGVLTVKSSSPMKHIDVKAGVAFLIKHASADVNGATSININIFCIPQGTITASITFMDDTYMEASKYVGK